MITFPRILFPVDFSPPTVRVAPFVRAMAQKFDSEVIMLHVLTPPSPLYVAGAGEYLDASRIWLDQHERLASFLATDYGESVVLRELVEGDPANEITSAAQRFKAGLIMMPTHGYRPFRRFLLGSVTAKVLHDSELPIWTGVHFKEVDATASGSLKRILCAVSLEDHESVVIGWAADLGESIKAEVQLLHVVSGLSEEQIKYGSEHRFAECLLEFGHERVKKLQETAGTTLPVSFRFGDQDSAVRKFAEDLQVDLIVIGRGTLQKAFGAFRSRLLASFAKLPVQ
jgi:nucleotide-binding universal stress UspA family protein